VSIWTAAITRSGAATATAAKDRLGPVAAWLFLCCAMIFLMVVVGGITRLTLSGLSITEWKPVVGIVPPLSATDWAIEFAKYKQIPEYRAVHFAMTLDEFKTIYFWEYFHRLLGRLIGFAYAVPFLWFLARRRLPRRLAPALAGVFFLGFTQGTLGWYMVESGLAHRVEVSQYRLVAHLALALAIYAAILWVALGIVSIRPSPPFRGEREGPAPKASEGEVGEAGAAQRPGPPHPALSARPAGGEGEGAGPGWRRVAEAILFLVALTILAGGFVAGTRAGLTYNTFPLIDGRLVPAGYAELHPFYLNWFENIAAVQFDHRVLAVATAAAVLLAWAAGRRASLPKPARAALHAVLAATALQVTLGISTLLLVVPIPLAAAHQAGAVLLLTAAIVLRHTVRAAPVMDVPARVTI
jgi:cytochrome c oxidase assembly protein subunit 15